MPSDSDLISWSDEVLLFSGGSSYQLSAPIS